VLGIVWLWPPRPDHGFLCITKCLLRLSRAQCLLQLLMAQCLLGLLRAQCPLGLSRAQCLLQLLATMSLAARATTRYILRIQGADLRKYDKYKKRLHLPTAPLWYNCRKRMLKQECIEVEWVSIPSHLLLYTMHLWSCRSYTGSSLI
jgi:hypothetical protein